MMAPLRLESISAGYGATRVLESLSLDVAAGSITALLGPSGCGKTTVLRVVAGLLPALTGDVWLGGERLTAVPAERRDIGVVFQKPLLFPHMSVADNVGFGLAMRGVPVGARRAQVDEALGLVRLEGFGDRRPKALSGGQEQRVSLARALVTRPRVLLLDEPLSALDEHLRGDMRGLIRDLQQRLAITTVFVTHDQDEAAEMADQVALLLGGRLAQHGNPREFYTAPRSADVARFFGWCVLGDSAFHPTAARLVPRSQAVSRAPASPATALPATVEQLTDLGHQARVRVRLDSGQRLEVVRMHDEEHIDATAGGLVSVVLPSGALWTFPRESEGELRPSARLGPAVT